MFYYLILIGISNYNKLKFKKFNAVAQVTVVQFVILGQTHRLMDWIIKVTFFYNKSLCG